MEGSSSRRSPDIEPVSDGSALSLPLPSLPLVGCARSPNVSTVTPDTQSTHRTSLITENGWSRMTTEKKKTKMHWLCPMVCAELALASGSHDQ